MNELKLVHYQIEQDIIIPETNFFTLSIENRHLLLKFLTELRSQIESGSQGDFNLLFNDKMLKIEKNTAAVFDFTDINFNSKSITNLLTKKFTEFLGLGEQSEALINLESIILNLAEDFRLKSGLNIDYDATINSNNLAKVCSLRIADGGGNLIKRLCEYVNLLCDLKSLKLFILVFGKQFLTEDDICNLHKYCLDKSVMLLIIEGTDKTERLESERRLIIDNDLCAIAQGYCL
jgi:CRISPR type II-A-associated protein Csn2